MIKVPLRVAVIGCGRMGQLHAQAVAKHSASQLVGVCDVDSNRANELGKCHGVPSFCEHVDLFHELRPQVAVVATPDHLHRDVTLAAIDERCHVFCEKPLAENVGEARQMVEAAKQANAKLAVNYNRRYGFAYQNARQLLDHGDVGQVLRLTIDVVDSVPPAAVARTADVMLTTLLTHHFDLVRFLAGEIKTVTACFAPAFEGLHRNVSVIFELVSGAQAVVIGTYLSTQRRTSELAILWGSQALVHMVDVTGAVHFSPTDSDDTQIIRPDRSEPGDAFSLTSHYHLHDFLDRLARGESPAVSGLDGLRGLQIAEAARQSHQQKTPIALES